MTESESRRRFDALFAAYGPDIVAYCSWRAGSESDAQDAAAEVFLTAWRRLDAVPEGEAARVWLYATARRVIANQRRSSRRRAALQERLLSEAPAPSLASRWITRPRSSASRCAGWGRATARCCSSPSGRGLSPAEIGAVLGCLAVTARGRLHRARRRFRAVFEDVRGEGRASRELPLLAKEGPKHA